MIHRIIDLVERKPNTPPAAGGTLTLKCKDFSIISFDFHNTEELSNVSASLECLSSIGMKRKSGVGFYHYIVYPKNHLLIDHIFLHRESVSSLSFLLPASLHCNRRWLDSI